MILKIQSIAHSYSTDGTERYDHPEWTYIDGIRTLKRWDTDETDTFIDDYGTAGAESCTWLLERRAAAPDRIAQAVVVLDCEFHTGTKRRYVIAPTTAYLMNDAGKTVERL